MLQRREEGSGTISRACCRTGGPRGSPWPCLTLPHLHAQLAPGRWSLRDLCARSLLAPVLAPLFSPPAPSHQDLLGKVGRCPAAEFLCCSPFKGLCRRGHGLTLGRVGAAGRSATGMLPRLAPRQRGCRPEGTDLLTGLPGNSFLHGPGRLGRAPPNSPAQPPGGLRASLVGTRSCSGFALVCSHHRVSGASPRICVDTDSLPRIHELSPHTGLGLLFLEGLGCSFCGAPRADVKGSISDQLLPVTTLHGRVL